MKCCACWFYLCIVLKFCEMLEFENLFHLQLKKIRRFEAITCYNFKETTLGIKFGFFLKIAFFSKNSNILVSRKMQKKFYIAHNNTNERKYDQTISVHSLSVFCKIIKF